MNIQNKKDAFLNGIADLLLSSPPGNTASWITESRTSGMNRFTQIGFPTQKSEAWRYTNVDSIAGKAFQLPQEHTLIERDQFNNFEKGSQVSLVFVNGQFQPGLSNLKDIPSKCTIANFSDTEPVTEGLIKPYLDRYSSTTEDTFEALNRAFIGNGTVIKVDDRVVIDPLIHIIHIISSKTGNLMTFPRTLIILGKSSEAQVMESHVSFSDITYFTNALTDIFAGEDSKLRYYKAQGENQKALHIGSTRIWQERNSQVESFSFSTGAALCRNNLSVVLNGEGSSSILNGLYAVSGNQHVDNHTVVEHRPPNCTSNQLYKGILDGSATSAFNGKILVRREAQKTNSYQLNKNLLLGKTCVANTKPQLEIFADDVRCTHGATIGQLNEDELFYLQTRAISKEKAIKMLSRGFVDDILGRITNPFVHDKMDRLLTNAFSALQ